MKFSKRLIIAVLALTMVSLAGCSGQDTAGNSASSANGTSAESTASDTVIENREDQPSEADNSEIAVSDAASADTENSKSGKCGENATYTINDDKTLTISGTGEMYDYKEEKDSSAPWRSEYYQAVVIESGITHIGSYAFYKCSAKEITIPDSVASVGACAFSGLS